MTKTDFAELKEKLCRKIYVDIYVQREHDAAIISELIEIIKLQSEALEYYKDGNGIDADFDENNGMVYYLEKTKDGLLEGFGFRSRESLSETTTRLQKLREGNNGNTTN